MSRCYALKPTDRGWRPCRNYAEVLAEDTAFDGVKEIYYSPTCRHHRTFFDTWLNRLYSIANGLEWFPIERNHVQRILQEGIVEITQEFIETLPYRRSYNHFLLLCVRHTNLRFNWNTRLCAVSVTWCWHRFDSAGPIKIKLEDFVLFLASMDDVKEGFFHMLELCGSHSQQPVPLGKLFSLIDTLLESDAGLPALLDPSFPSTELLDIFKERSRNLPHLSHIQDMLESGEFTHYLLCLKQEFYTNCKRKLDPIRDELLEISWQPERVQDWCMSVEEVQRARKFELALGLE